MILFYHTSRVPSRASQSTKFSRFPCWWFVFPKYVSNKCPLIMVEVKTWSPPNVESITHLGETHFLLNHHCRRKSFLLLLHITGFLQRFQAWKVSVLALALLFPVTRHHSPLLLMKSHQVLHPNGPFNGGLPISLKMEMLGSKDL